jgi:hypothetical protein
VPEVRLTHPEKVLFPEAGLTKADLAAYYERVAPLMLPYLQGRPVSMQRFPDGVGKHGFFHKDIPDYFPDWFQRVSVPKSGGYVTHPIVANPDSLVYLANQNTITPHVWLSRQDNHAIPTSWCSTSTRPRTTSPRSGAPRETSPHFSMSWGFPRFQWSRGRAGYISGCRFAATGIPSRSRRSPVLLRRSPLGATPRS